MQNILDSLLAFLTSPTLKIVLLVSISLLILTIIVLLIRQIKEIRSYDVFVRIYPAHSKVKVYNKEKGKYENIVMPYFVPGTYYFDKNTGEYNVIIKDPDKKNIGAISFDFFVPINYKRYKYMLTLAKVSPVDYKPIKTRIKYNKLKEIHNVYDTDAIYVGLKTIEEVQERFMKKSKFEKFLPYILTAVVIIVVLIAFILILREMDKIVKSLHAVSDSLSKVAENLLLATK